MNDRVKQIQDFYENDFRETKKFIDLAATYPNIQKDNLSDEHDAITDLILSIYLFLFDISICHKHLLIYKEQCNYYEMNYFLRALSTHLVDALDDSNKARLISRIKDVSRKYNAKTLTDTQSKELGKKVKKLNDIKKTNLPYLKKIRNNSFAHRDGDGIEQYENINNINVESIAKISSEIKELFDNLPKDLLEIQLTIYPV